MYDFVCVYVRVWTQLLFLLVINVKRHSRCGDQCLLGNSLQTPLDKNH